MAHESFESSRLNLRHLLGVLVGRRDSIVVAAQDRWTIWVGFAFVLIGGIARNYDGADLLREPWHLLIPFAVSVALSLCLFALVRRSSRDSGQSFTQGYRVFLSLFWLTAPMALLYAIPYERMLAPADAVRANLWTLALVSVWRGLVVSRIVQLLTGRSFVASFFLSAFVADVFAATALLIVPIPTIQFMGGIRLSEVEHVIQKAGVLAGFVSAVSLPVLGITALVIRWKKSPSTETPSLSQPNGYTQLAWGPFVLAFAILLGFAFILPRSQREQRLRSDAERLLREKKLEDAVAEMSRHARSDYPPLWDPPPRLGWPEPEEPNVLAMAEAIQSAETTGWVRAVYLDKFERRYLADRIDLYYAGPMPWERIRQLLDRLPEGPEVRARHAEQILRIENSNAAESQPTTQL